MTIAEIIAKDGLYFGFIGFMLATTMLGIAVDDIRKSGVRGFFSFWLRKEA